MRNGLIPLAVRRHPTARAPTSATDAAAYAAPHRSIRMARSLASALGSRSALRGVAAGGPYPSLL